MYQGSMFIFGNVGFPAVCYFAPGGVQSIVMSMSVCLSVCLSVHVSRKLHDRTLPLWLWIGRSLMVLKCVMYFQFYGWHHFSYHGASGTESSTTLNSDTVNSSSLSIFKSKLKTHYFRQTFRLSNRNAQLSQSASEVSLTNWRYIN